MHFSPKFSHNILVYHPVLLVNPWLVVTWERKHPQYVDIYGNSIASSNTVPGGGFTVAHDNHKNTLNDILNTAGLCTIKEAANIFRGKVSATHHDAYLENFIRNSDSNQ
jgi:hypothetical protein